MSSTIVYAKQFVKTTNELIIPLVLIGSSNCTMSSYNNGRAYTRRARDWGSLYSGYANKPIAVREEDILAIVQSEIELESQEHFKFGNKWVDHKHLVSFIKNGIKNAHTLEELKIINSGVSVSLQAYLSVYTAGPDVYSDGTLKNQNRHERHRNIDSSSELDEFLSLAAKRIDNKASNETIYIRLGYSQDKPLPYNFSRINNSERIPGEYWVIKFSRYYNDGYLMRLTSGQAKLTLYEGSAKQFKSENAALKYMEKYRFKSRFPNNKAWPVLISSKTKIVAEAI